MAISEEDVIEQELWDALPKSPMIEPSEQKPKKKTKLQRFIEELSKYPDKDTAKQAIPDIAKKLKCSKALGYKALRKVSKFIGETPIEQAVEPTIKIPKAPEIPIEEATTAQPTETPVAEEIPFEQIETEQPTPQAPITQPPIFPMTTEKLQTTIDILFSKVADLTQYPQWKLEKRESQALAEAWLPVLQQYAPQMATNPAIWASFTTIVIIAPRVIGYWNTRRKRAKEKIIEPPSKSKNERESERESTEPPQEKPKPKPPELPKPEQVGFYKKLKEL